MPEVDRVDVVAHTRGRVGFEVVDRPTRRDRELDVAVAHDLGRAAVSAVGLGRRVGLPGCAGSTDFSTRRAAAEGGNRHEHRERGREASSSHARAGHRSPLPAVRDPTIRQPQRPRTRLPSRPDVTVRQETAPA
jgi:hypothetical protein